MTGEETTLPMRNLANALSESRLLLMNSMRNGCPISESFNNCKEKLSQGVD